MAKRGWRKLYKWWQNSFIHGHTGPRPIASTGTKKIRQQRDKCQEYYTYCVTSDCLSLRPETFFGQAEDAACKPSHTVTTLSRRSQAAGLIPLNPPVSQRQLLCAGVPYSAAQTTMHTSPLFSTPSSGGPSTPGRTGHSDSMCHV
jgi:hypothetical protein